MEQNNQFDIVPGNVVIEEKVIKRLTGEAIAGIDGILGVKGGFSDLLKGEDDPTRGITVNMGDEQTVTVCLKIITESGKNIPAIVTAATNAITNSLQNTAGLRVKDVAIEVSDTMSRAEYYKDSESEDIDTMPL